MSVIIPCLNERAHIGRCLDTLLADSIPPGCLDVVVVDGGSTDGTREIVEGYSRGDSRVRMLDNPRRSKPAALNIGIAATHSDVVVRIDAHASYAPDYLSRVVAGLDLHHCDNVGGIRENLVGTTLSDRAVASAISHPFAAGDASYRTRPGLQVPREVDTVFCGCYRRSVFERIGVFNEALLRTQDREFNQRLRAAGGKIVLDPAIRCWYHPRVSLLAHIQWTWDGAFWLFMARRFTDTSMLRPRNYVPFLFVAWHAAPVALLPLSPPLAALSACPLLFYWFLNLAFSTQVAFREGRPGLLAVLPWYFAGTHYAYGLASLAGAMVGWTHPRQVYPTTPSPPLSVPIPPTRDD